MSVDPTRIDIDFDPREQRMVGIAYHGNTPFDVPFISRISGNLWQGGCENGLVLPAHIKHVVSLYPWERYTVRHELDSFVEVRLYDAGELPNVAQLTALADWINVCAATAPTLVHCQAGLNRSGLLAGLALVRSGMDGADAINLLRDSRSPAVLCNRTFAEWLANQ